VRLDPGDEFNQMLHNGSEYNPRGLNDGWIPVTGT
jgi:hypothetical protein